MFECLVKPCKGKGRNPRCVNRFLDKKDAKSTGNLRKHARLCWGDETVRAGDETKDILAAREAVKKNQLKDGSLTAVFERIGKGTATYSHRQHMKTESKWVSSLC
jgi:DNA phosphorothioation-dependent restriction protein DptG